MEDGDIETNSYLDDYNAEIEGENLRFIKIHNGMKIKGRPVIFSHKRAYGIEIDLDKLDAENFFESILIGLERSIDPFHPYYCIHATEKRKPENINIVVRSIIEEIENSDRPNVKFFKEYRGEKVVNFILESHNLVMLNDYPLSLPATLIYFARTLSTPSLNRYFSKVESIFGFDVVELIFNLFPQISNAPSGMIAERMDKKYAELHDPYLHPTIRNIDGMFSSGSSYLLEKVIKEKIEVENLDLRLKMKIPNPQIKVKVIPRVVFSSEYTLYLDANNPEMKNKMKRRMSNYVKTIYYTEIGEPIFLDRLTDNSIAFANKQLLSLKDLYGF